MKINHCLKKYILINTKITLTDFIKKYTLRDFYLGLIRNISGSFGILIRGLTYKIIFRRCLGFPTIKEGVIFKFPEKMEIGRHVSFNEYCFIDAEGGIKIKDFVRIGPMVSIFSFSHHYRLKKRPIKLQGKSLKKIIIEKDVWIGTKASLLEGVKIGQGAVIAAHSLVNKNVPPFSLAKGTPAKSRKCRK